MHTNTCTTWKTSEEHQQQPKNTTVDRNGTEMQTFLEKQKWIFHEAPKSYIIIPWRCLLFFGSTSLHRLVSIKTSGFFKEKSYSKRAHMNWLPSWKCQNKAVYSPWKVKLYFQKIDSKISVIDFCFQNKRSLGYIHMHINMFFLF